MLRIGQHIARLDLEHIFRRECHADDPELLAPPVDNRNDRAAEVQTVGFHERFAGQHLVVAAKRELPAATQVELIQSRRTRHRQRDKLADARFVQPRYIERDQLNDPSFNRRNARNFR